MTSYRALAWSRIASALLVSSIAVASCDSAGPVEPEPEPPPLTSEWRATQVRGLTIPDAMYVIDRTIVDGREISLHWVVDSASLELSPMGGYDHRIWVSEWTGEVGGPPVHRAYRWYHGDFGRWERDGDALIFESEWLENHRMSGSYGADGILHMQHGFTHGDPPVDFTYGVPE